MNARVAAVAVTAAIALAACGKRGNPLPPLRRGPLPVSDLTLVQRGDQLLVTFTTPRATLGGEKLGLMEVQLAHALVPGDFARLAQRKTLKAAPGEALTQQLPLPPPGTLVRYQVTVRVGGERSPEAAAPNLVTQAPPEPPKQLVAEVIAAGIRLRFAPAPLPTPTPAASPTTSPAATSTPTAPPAPTGSASPTAPAEATAEATPTASPTAVPSPPLAPAPAPTPHAGTFVYRRADDGAYTRPLTALPIADATYEDTDIALDARVCYELRTAVSTSPLIESAASGEVCLVRRDIVPPAAPRGLTALESAGGVELEWSPAPDADVVAYRVYRTAAGAAPVRLAEVTQTRHRDEALPESARVVVYQVAAVDKTGNEGPLSAGVPARRP